MPDWLPELVWMRALRFLTTSVLSSFLRVAWSEAFGCTKSPLICFTRSTTASGSA